MAELIVHPVALVGGLQDSKAAPEPSDMQTLSNFSVFRGRFALRAPFTQVADLTGATKVLAIAAHNNSMYVIAYHGGSSETKLWELNDDGSSPVDRGQIWSGAAVPIPTMASIEGGLADARVSRLYIADYAEQYATRYYQGPADAAGTFSTVTEDWNDDGTKEDIKFNLVSTFQYHVWGTNYWGLTGETTGVRPEVAHFSRPGLIAETEPSVTNNPSREWWSVDYRAIGKRGDKFTNLGFIQNGMVMFKEYETYLLFGYDYNSWQARVLSPSAGCVGPYASTVTNDGLCFFWASGRGPHVTDGKQVIDISEDVRKRVLAANEANDTVVVYSPTDGLVYFIYREGTDSYPQHWLAYDKERRLWSEGEWLVGSATAVAAGKAVVVPQLTLPGPVGPPSPQTIFMQDTFTDTNGTDLDNHNWDVGGGNWKGGPDWGLGRDRIWNNEAQEVLANFGSGNYRASSTGVTHQVGWEAYADLVRDPNGVNNDVNGLVCAADGSNEYHLIGIDGVDANNVNIVFWRNNAGGAQDQITAETNYAMAYGAKVRLGITFTSTTAFKLWREPAGGGTRTILVASHAITADYLNGSHQKMGWRKNALAGSEMGMDNITLFGGVAGQEFTATAVEQNQINLAWTNGDVASDTVTEIYRDTSPTPTTKVATVASGVDTYQDKDATLVPDQTYYYRLRHLRNGQYSAYSMEASAKTWLAKPTGVTLGQIVNGIKVSFTQVADGADVKIYRRRNVDPGYTLVNTMSAVAAGSAYWDDTTVTCGNFYFYKLKVSKTGSTDSGYTAEGEGLTACGTPSIDTCSHTPQVDYYGTCWSRAVINWTGTDLGGSYVTIKRYFTDDPFGTPFTVGTVQASLLTFNDSNWIVTGSGGPSRSLYYTLELREGAPDGPIIDTCTTTTTNNTAVDCI